LTWRPVQAYCLANHLVSHHDDLFDGLGDEHGRRLTDAIKDIEQRFPNRCHCGARGLRESAAKMRAPRDAQSGTSPFPSVRV
jgi:hypothetical protein